MLDALRFVASAVAKKDFVPELTHFKIKNGRVTGYNGIIALSSDIDVDLDVQPSAIPLISAIRACPGVISLHMTAAGRLAVKSEGFKAYIQCLTEDHNHFVFPEGDTIDLGDDFLVGLKAIAPIMGIDASRPWSLGVRLRGPSLFATNNVMLAEYWHGHDIPLDIVIPREAVNEILRIDEAPSKAQVTANSMTFWWGAKKWLRTQLLDGGAWPTGTMDRVLNMPMTDHTPVANWFGDEIAKLKPFLNERQTVYLTSTGASTSLTEGDGASVEFDMPIESHQAQAYSYQQLILLAEVAQTIDWQTYPGPCMFMGERLRGAIIGQRL